MKKIWLVQGKEATENPFYPPVLFFFHFSSISFFQISFWFFPLPQNFKGNHCWKWGGMCVLSCSAVCKSLWSHGLLSTRLLCPWDFSGKNTGVGWHFFLQGIFLTQGSNPCLLCLLPCRQILYHLSHQGSQCPLFREHCTWILGYWILMKLCVLARGSLLPIQFCLRKASQRIFMSFHQKDNLFVES